MNIIYKPKGPALEYAPMALNIYNGCTHMCRYCYAPSALRKAKEEYFKCGNPKKNVLKRVRKAAEKLSLLSCDDEIMLSFIGDPYQPIERELELTREIIKILIENNLRFMILTKGGSLAKKDFDLLEGYDKCRFGVTLTMWKNADAKHWEPNASSVYDRLNALLNAKNSKIKTWVSLEPVIDPEQALNLIKDAAPLVDHWKIGKINHWPEIEKQHDWIKFREDVITLMEKLNADYYLKNSLKKI